jgi:hypothetical protein
VKVNGRKAAANPERNIGEPFKCAIDFRLISPIQSNNKHSGDYLL